MGKESKLLAVYENEKVVQEVSGWLRVYQDGSVDRTWTGPPEVRFMSEPVAPSDKYINGVATKDVAVEESSGLRVRVYLPEQKSEATTKLPIILHFHGGGFCITQADWYMYYHIYTKLAPSVNAVVVSVYQRLAPEHRLPAAIDDGYSALLWLRSLARGHQAEPWLLTYGDFNRVFLVGDSSGGNLVHHVASRAGNVDLTPLRLAGGVPIHPGFVRAERRKSEVEQPQSPFLTLDMVDKFLGLALPVGSTKDHPITCPMGPAAAPLDSVKLPPFLLCIAEKDLMIDTEMEYFEAMKAAGNEVELLMSKGMTHSFYLNKIAVDMDPEMAGETERLLAGIKEFVEHH